MDKNDVEKALKIEYDFSSGRVLQYGQRMADVEKIRPILEALLSVPRVEDVGRIDLGTDWQKKDQPRIYLYLKESAKDSPFVREVVKALHITLKKEDDGDGLRCTADLSGVSFAISNYLPAACVVTYVEEMVPARMERLAKVVCGGEEEA